MTILITALLFILGTAIGSFLSVIIYRIEEKKLKIVMARSMCPHCKKTLKPKYLVPIFSWIFLRGQCPYCKNKISAHYLILELTTGIMFAVGFLKWTFVTTTTSAITPTAELYQINWLTLSYYIYYTIIASFLITIMFYDIKKKKIPDKLSIPAIIFAIAGSLIFKEPTIISAGIGGATIFIFFALQYVLSKGKWIGGGDIRMGLLVGLILGWEKGLVALFLAYFIGGILGTILLVSKKLTRKSKIAFGPFLVIGTFVAMFYGTEILNWYLNVGI